LRLEESNGFGSATIWSWSLNELFLKNELMREMNSPLVRLLGLLSLVLRLRQRSLRRSLRPESRSGTRHPDAGLIRDWDPIRISGYKLGKILVRAGDDGEVGVRRREATGVGRGGRFGDGLEKRHRVGFFFFGGVDWTDGLGFCD